MSLCFDRGVWGERPAPMAIISLPTKLYVFFEDLPLRIASQ